MASLLETIDEKILAVLNAPESYTDYKMGEKTYSRKSYLDFLYKQRALALGSPEPDIAVIEFDGFNVDEFGERT